MSGVPGRTSIATVLAYLGIPSDFKPREHRYVPDNLFSEVDAGYLASWLDCLVETARHLLEKADFAADWYVARLVRRLVVMVLEAGPAVRPERVWAWIKWLDWRRGYSGDINKRLIAIFRENRALRSGILEHVLLTPCAENTWMAGHRLFDTGLELYPTAGDLAGVLRALRARTRGGRIDRETWRGILLRGRTADGLPASIRSAAVEAAAGDEELLSLLDEFSERPDAEWGARQAQREGKSEARRQAVYRVHRQRLAESAGAVAAWASGEDRLCVTVTLVEFERSEVDGERPP